MENYFTQEIKSIKHELTQLKTAAETSAGSVPTISHSLSVSIPLSLENSDLATGTAHVRLSATQDELLMATLDSYYDDVTQATNFPATTRSVQMLLNYLDNDTIIVRLVAEGNASDRSTLSGGGSVTITKQLTVRSTDDFTMEVMDGE